MSATQMTTTMTNPEFSTMSPTPKTGTFLRLEQVTVEDIRGVGPAAVDRLLQALSVGAPFRKDRKRRHFYEVIVGGECFYIHVMDDARKVLLLARWINPDDAIAARA